MVPMVPMVLMVPIVLMVPMVVGAHCAACCLLISKLVVFPNFRPQFGKFGAPFTRRKGQCGRMERQLWITKHQRGSTKHRRGSTKHQRGSTKHQRGSTKHQRGSTEHQRGNKKHWCGSITTTSFGVCPLCYACTLMLLLGFGMACCHFSCHMILLLWPYSRTTTCHKDVVISGFRVLGIMVPSC